MYTSQFARRSARVILTRTFVGRGSQRNGKLQKKDPNQQQTNETKNKSENKGDEKLEYHYYPCFH